MCLNKRPSIITVVESVLTLWLFPCLCFEPHNESVLVLRQRPTTEYDHRAESTSADLDEGTFSFARKRENFYDNFMRRMKKIRTHFGLNIYFIFCVTICRVLRQPKNEMNAKIMDFRFHPRWAFGFDCFFVVLFYRASAVFAASSHRNRNRVNCDFSWNSFSP